MRFLLVYCSIPTSDSSMPRTCQWQLPFQSEAADLLCPPVVTDSLRRCPLHCSHRHDLQELATATCSFTIWKSVPTCLATENPLFIHAHIATNARNVGATLLNCVSASGEGNLSAKGTELSGVPLGARGDLSGCCDHLLVTSGSAWLSDESCLFVLHLLGHEDFEQGRLRFH
jgi:hypothetical protein